MKKTFLYILTAAVLSTVLFSCASTNAKNSKNDFEEPVSPPPSMTTMPVIEYTGKGIKYEFESMLLYHFATFSDKTASGGFAVRLLDESSTAQLKVKFPAGTYECLISEKAFSSNSSAFYVYIDGIPYRVYPSDPPLQEWELTTRTPVYFTIDEPRTILITIQANSEHRLGSTGMNLDYIQFVKR